MHSGKHSFILTLFSQSYVLVTHRPVTDYEYRVAMSVQIILSYPSLFLGSTGWFVLVFVEAKIMLREIEKDNRNT